MDEEDGDERDPGEDNLGSKNSSPSRLAVDHNEFAHIPCGECQNKTPK